MGVRPIIRRGNVTHTIGVGRELIAFLEAGPFRLIRVINGDRLSAVLLITVKQGTSVGPSPT